MSLCVLRQMRQGDRPFVRSSWLKSWRRFSKLPSSVYWSDFGHSGLVDHLLDTAPTWIAHPELHDDVIAGWLCGETGTLHYAYVQQAFRAAEFGVLEQMLCVKRLHAKYVDVVDVTHPRPEVLELLKRNGVEPKVIDPYAVYGRKDKAA